LGHGAAASVPLARIGIRLGLYKAMDGAGPMTSAELAAKTNISERYAREWLAQSAASGGPSAQIPRAKTMLGLAILVCPDLLRYRRC
jgi:hypothetical protein